MNEVFYKNIVDLSKKIGVKLNEEQSSDFFDYMNILLEWNEKINLTAITKEDEVILKHFIDSLTVLKYIQDDKNIIDVGTGAGFPGIPIAIMNNDCNVTLMDSLNKRILFLNEVVEGLELKNVVTIHSRAEDLGKNKNYREKFDVAVSRAVANLTTLSEYLLPFVKVGGKCICMKGANVEEEINESKKAIEILGGKIESVNEFCLPDTDMKRNIIIIRKIKKIDAKFPRKAGIPSKEPLK